MRVRRALQAAEGKVMSEWEEGVRKFARAILHGDREHRAWLLEAAELFIRGALPGAPSGGDARHGNSRPTESLTGWRETKLGWVKELGYGHVYLHFDSSWKLFIYEGTRPLAKVELAVVGVPAATDEAKVAADDFIALLRDWRQ